MTPWDWSFDLTEEAAAEMLEACPEGCVLAVHSPPRGHVDVGGAGKHLGSEAVLRAIESKRPRLALCGHVHESWGQESEIGPTRVINLGPQGMMLEPSGPARLSVAARRLSPPASSSTAIAALRPLSAITEPPGWVAAPHR